jgi:hypothetical protein
VNQAFSEFIREGVATPGFDRFPKTIGIENITNLTYSELREVLIGMVLMMVGVLLKLQCGLKMLLVHS